MRNDVHFSICGALCSDCPSYKGEDEHSCLGCAATQGKPWWGRCKVYECYEGKGVDHCGLCSDFPCKLFISHYDPDNPEGQKNAVIRVGVLAYRVKHGDDKAVELLRKVKAS